MESGGKHACQGNDQVDNEGMSDFLQRGSGMGRGVLWAEVQERPEGSRGRPVERVTLTIADDTLREDLTPQRWLSVVARPTNRLEIFKPSCIKVREKNSRALLGALCASGYRCGLGRQLGREAAAAVRLRGGDQPE